MKINTVFIFGLVKRTNVLLSLDVRMAITRVHRKRRFKGSWLIRIGER